MQMECNTALVVIVLRTRLNLVNGKLKNVCGLFKGDCSDGHHGKDWLSHAGKEQLVGKLWLHKILT